MVETSQAFDLLVVSPIGLVVFILSILFCKKILHLPVTLTLAISFALGLLVSISLKLTAQQP